MDRLLSTLEGNQSMGTGAGAAKTYRGPLQIHLIGFNSPGELAESWKFLASAKKIVLSGLLFFLHIVQKEQQGLPAARTGPRD